MERLYESPDDFEAVVRILTEREGGRHVPPRNGIRWDLRYFFQGEDEISMVWPEFLDETGNAISPDRPLAGMLRARFYVVAETMRDFHRQHARPGVGFFCVEGAKVCAAGVVTRVTGLAERTGKDALSTTLSTDPSRPRP
jgi:hypothetical protein